MAGIAESGAARIAREREKQLERWGASHDEMHQWDELVWAALAYLEGALAERSPGKPGKIRWAVRGHLQESMHGNVRAPWPWSPPAVDPKDQDDVRCLEKAGALVAAEIDRRLRAKLRREVLEQFGPRAVPEKAPVRFEAEDLGYLVAEWNERPGHDALLAVFREIRRRLDVHEDRLDSHEERIASLERARDLA